MSHHAQLTVYHCQNPSEPSDQGLSRLVPRLLPRLVPLDFLGRLMPHMSFPLKSSAPLTECRRSDLKKHQEHADIDVGLERAKMTSL